MPEKPKLHRVIPFLIKTPKDFDYGRERLQSEQETKLRVKNAAESGWKQDVSNSPLSMERIGLAPDGAECLSVSFVRAAFLANV